MEMFSHTVCIQVISVLHGFLVQAVTAVGPKGQRPQGRNEVLN